MGAQRARITDPNAFKALHEIAVALGTVRDAAEMASFVTRSACGLLGGDGALLAVWDERTQEIRAAAEYGTILGTARAAVRLGDGMVGQAARQRTPIAIEDYRDWPHALPRAIERGVRSAVAVPLLAADQLIGTLVVHFSTPQQFAREHAELLALLAAQVAPALRSAQLHAQHANMVDRERRLREMSRSLASDLDEAHALELATRCVSELMTAPYARLWLAETDGSVRCAAGVGFSPEEAVGYHLPSDSLVGKALRERLINVDDATRSPGWSNPEFCERTGLGPYLVVPFQIGGEALGALVAMRARGNVFREDDERLLAGLADVVAVAIANARALGRLAHSEQRLRAIYEAIACGILVQDADGVILHANSTAEEYFGYSLEDMRGRSSVELWKVLGEDGVERSPTGRNVLVAARTGRAVKSFTTCIVPPDGRRLWVQGNAVPIRGLDGSVQVVSSFIDISKRKQAEDEITYQAEHDALTGLPNRNVLSQRLARAVSAEAPAGTSASVGLLLMDLDHFKEINDTLGHHAGDALLQQVGNRLRDVVRGADTVARLGGDEFAILLPGTSLEHSRRVAHNLLEALRPPLNIEGQAVAIGGSIGIAMYPAHGQDAATLLRRADVAMYVAKRSETGVSVYSVAQDAHALDRLALLPQLREAIESPTETNHLVLHYQPKLNVSTGQLCGVEALVRWQHPRHGLVGPDRFVPLAEQTGVGRTLSHWVIETAMRQARAWDAAGELVQIAVNLSMRDVQDAELPDRVDALLEELGLPGAALAVEITESTLMADPERALDVLKRLRLRGVRLSIDDFGTGYSSLAYLKRLPVHELKLDRMFVCDASSRADDQAIMGSIVDLAHSLGLEVVAEGVEDEATWRLLGRLGCDFAQGYHLSRPLAAEQLERWLRRAAGEQAA